MSDIICYCPVWTLCCVSETSRLWVYVAGAGAWSLKQHRPSLHTFLNSCTLVCTDMCASVQHSAGKISDLNIATHIGTLSGDLSCDNESSRMIVFTSQSKKKKSQANAAKRSHMERRGRREWKHRERTWNEEHIFSCTAVKSVGVGSGSKTNTLYLERVCMRACVEHQCMVTRSQTDRTKPPPLGISLGV